MKEFYIQKLMSDFNIDHNTATKFYNFAHMENEATFKKFFRGEDLEKHVFILASYRLGKIFQKN